MRRRAPSVLAATALVSVLSYCGGITRGTPISVDLVLVPAVSEGTVDRFSTASGWTIELDEAAIALGPVWLYGGGARAALTPDLGLGLPSAVAHPADDTFDRGEVLGELLAQVAVDLKAPSTSMGRLEGFEGDLQTFELQLRPAGFGPIAGAAVQTLGTSTFRLAGRATKDGRTVPFLAEGDLPELNDQQVIDSIPATVTLAAAQAGAGPLNLHLLLDEWLGLVDFARLPDEGAPTDSEGRYLFNPDAQPTAALHRGMRSRFAYRLEWTSP